MSRITGERCDWCGGYFLDTDECCEHEGKRYHRWCLDRIRNLAAAVPSPPQQAEAGRAAERRVSWQSITSAPRDGTAFLACDADDRMAVCYYSLDRTLCYEASEAIVEEEDFRPTHWMPVPEPP